MYVTTYEQSKRSFSVFFTPSLPPLQQLKILPVYSHRRMPLASSYNFSDKLSDSSNKLTYKSDIA